MICKHCTVIKKKLSPFFHDAVGPMIDYDVLKNNVTLTAFGSLDW